MANVTSLVNDLFDIISESSIKPKEMVSVMVEMLVALDDAGVLDDYESELEECRGINGKLDDAINQYIAKYEEDIDPEDLDYSEYE